MIYVTRLKQKNRECRKGETEKYGNKKKQARRKEFSVGRSRNIVVKPCMRCA